jgi:hypothetical protein
MLTHPLLPLGFEPQKPSLADLGFAPQKAAVDSRKPSSRRGVVQSTNNPIVNQALATRAMPEFTTRLLLAIAHIPGARLARSRSVKNSARLAQKIEQEGQPPETVSDYGAAQVAVASPQARDAVVAAVRKHFKVLKEQNRFALGDSQFRYRSDSLQVEMPDGASEELQIVPEEVLEANRAEHPAYVTARNAELAGRSAEGAKAAARALNDDAMNRFNVRNGVVTKGRVQKGSRVRLSDGALARVEYVDPNMRIARVRTEDGRNITVRHKDLRETF